MQAGLLNEIIEIQIPMSTINEFGSTKITYSKWITTRANVRQNGQNRSIQENEVFYDVAKTFIIRSYIDIQESHRIVYQGKPYRIVSIDYDRHNNCKTIVADLINE